jgi:hypothetical protein
MTRLGVPERAFVSSFPLSNQGSGKHRGPKRLDHMTESDREISGKDFLADVRAGLDDVGLMRKYEVTRRQLLGVLKKLADVGILDTLEKAALEINSQCFTFDVRSGLTDEQLRIKYALSELELEAVLGRLIFQGSLTLADGGRKQPLRFPAPHAQPSLEQAQSAGANSLAGNGSSKETEGQS